MNKSEFLTKLNGRLPYSKEEIEFMFEIISDIVLEGLASSGVVRTPLGTFKKVLRKERKVRLIRSKEITTLPPKEKVVFKPSKKIQND